MGASGGILSQRQTEADVAHALRDQRAAWERRPLLRELYTEWHQRMRDQLSALPGPTIELGCGIGAFKEFYPRVVATDVVPTLWCQELADAQELPYPDGSLANIVMIDVLHHLSSPERFFEEAQRALAPGARVVMLEPYCSPISRLAYRFAHHEGANLRVDPFSSSWQSNEHPLAGNNALAYLIFWRHLERFSRRHPGLEVISRDRFAWLLYPLSGGFTKRQLVPYWMRSPLGVFERALRPLAALAAFRCLVALEKR